MIAETGEVLCGVMRPGNAGANNAADHAEVLDAAIAQLPEVWAAGHDLAEDSEVVQRRALVRADSGGASHWLTEEIRACNAEFSIGYAIDQRVRDALMLTPEEDWICAIDAGGQRRGYTRRGRLNPT